MIKKSHPKFNVPNYGARSRKRVPERWRKQRGIDNKKRIKKSFMGAEPTIGYGNPKELKGVRIDGKIIKLVHNINELNAVLEEIKAGATAPNITIASSVATKKRVLITGIAAKSGLRVTNGAYK